jgi:tetratricopeptide (TPR) repeat protein
LDITSQAMLDGYSNLSLIYANEGDIEKAIEIINTGLAIAPGASPLYLSLGGVYGGLVLDSKAELDVAEANYQWAASQYFSASTVEQRTAASFTLDQTEIIYSQAKKNLEELQSNLEVNISQASNAYQKALKYQPDSVNALIGLGRLSNVAGDTQKTIEYYQLAVDLNPTSTLALNNLANYLLDLERPYDALPLLHKSLSYSPSNLATLYSLFRAYKSIGDFNASDAVAPINYGHYWLLNYVNLFRTFEKNNPLK